MGGTERPVVMLMQRLESERKTVCTAGSLDASVCTYAESAFHE
jgi:hypothetical protein